MDNQEVHEETSEQKPEETQKPTEQNYFSRIKKIFTRESAKKNLTAIVSSTKIAVVIGAIALSCLTLTSYKYFSLRKSHDKLSQEYSKAVADTNQLSQEYEQLRQESAASLENITKDYTTALKENEQFKKKIEQSTGENKQAKQQFQELDKRYRQLEEDNKKTLAEISALSEEYQAVASENKQLKSQQEELREKEAKTLEELTKEHVPSTEYHSEYGFPNYQEGSINKQNNWMSSDTLDKKGWQVIKRKSPPDAWVPFENNVLTFLPPNFTTFSPEDNYTTLHLHSDRPIKTFSLGGEYNILKNGFLEIYVSGDNKEWIKLQYFDSKDKDSYRGGWSTSYYANVNPVWGRLTLVNYPYVKLYKDLFVRHSAGAMSDKNYEVEIWKFFASINTE